MADLTLIGYRYSVYTRIVRMLLAEKAQDAVYVEADPFADDPDPVLQAASPFGRVPVLRHDGFTIYETAAITQYLDAVFSDPPLCPSDPRRAARMRQVIGIVDSYAYPVLVRMVYSHAVFRPAVGVPPDAATLEAGLAQAPRVLAALEAIAAEGLQLSTDRPSLADFHLAPMIAAFAAAPPGAALLASQPALSRWFAAMAERPCFRATRAGLLRSRVPLHRGRREGTQ